MGYRGAGLPFHSSCQGLSPAHKDPERQRGLSCASCTCPAAVAPLTAAHGETRPRPAPLAKAGAPLGLGGTFLENW